MSAGLATSRSSSFSHSSSSSYSSFPSTPSPPHNIAAVVPFLWEEKPGVSKQQKQNKDGLPNATNKGSSKLPELFALFTLPTGETLADWRPLRPPPCLQKPSQVAAKKSPGRDFTISNNEDRRSVSESLPKKRQTRKLKAEDDPFFMAIQACTQKVETSSGTNGFLDVLRKNPRTLYDGLCISEEEQSFRKSTGRSSFFRNQSSGVEVKVSGLNIKHAIQALAQRRAEDQDYYGALTRSVAEDTRQSTIKKSEKSSSRSREKPTSVHTSPDREIGNPIALHSLVQIKSSMKQPVTTRRQQCQPIQLSCGHHKRIGGVSNKQILADWMGCRNVKNYDSIVNLPERPQVIAKVP